jgi:lipopolysaccharide heptosyltransferase II
MKTSSKVIVDTIIGRPLVFLLNLAARMLGQILRPNHSLYHAPKKIVVCKFLGMGSIVQATPLLQTLKKNFPSTKLIFVTSKTNRKLLEMLPMVDKVLVVDDSGMFATLATTMQLLFNLWKEKIDLHIDLETYSYYSTALSTMSCTRNRFGFYRKGVNIRMGVYTHMMFFNARAPISQVYLQMARLAGCKEIVNSIYKFEIRDEVKRTLSEKLRPMNFKTDKKYVVINPNASDLRIERRWAKENFVTLINRLASSSSEMQFVLIGAANEADYVTSVFAKVDEQYKPSLINTAGKLNLEELIALIDACALMVSNDTGPMHLSFALNKPTVALFGPCSPQQYGLSENAFSIYKNIYCSPCVHEFITPPCKGDNQCMKQIKIEEVFNLCMARLKESERGAQSIIAQPITFLKEDNTALGIVSRN